MAYPGCCPGRATRELLPSRRNPLALLNCPPGPIECLLGTEFVKAYLAVSMFSLFFYVKGAGKLRPNCSGLWCPSIASSWMDHSAEQDGLHLDEMGVQHHLYCGHCFAWHPSWGNWVPSAMPKQKLREKGTFGSPSTAYTNPSSRQHSLYICILYTACVSRREEDCW